MASNFVVRQSSVKQWRKCRQAYHYKQVEGLRRKRKPRPLVFGTIIHKMIEANAEGFDPWKVLDHYAEIQGKMFRSEIEHYGDIVGDIAHIMEEYFDYWKEKGDISYIRRKGKSAEHKFEIDLGNGLQFEGKIDAFVRAKKLKWLTEHKSGKRKWDDDTRWRNIQSCVYIRAVDMLGWLELDGTLWDHIWSKSPTKPEVLKSGALSKRNIDTLPNVVLAVIEENGLDPEDYTDLIELTRDKRSSYFERVFTPRKEDVINRVFEDFVATGLEMAELHGRDKTRNIELHCSFCEFEPLCRAELQGSDVDFIKEREYTVNEETDEEVEFEE